MEKKPTKKKREKAAKEAPLRRKKNTVKASLKENGRGLKRKRCESLPPIADVIKKRGRAGVQQEGPSPSEGKSSRRGKAYYCSKEERNVKRVKRVMREQKRTHFENPVVEPFSSDKEKSQLGKKRRIRKRYFTRKREKRFLSNSRGWKITYPSGRRPKEEEGGSFRKGEII